MGNQRQDVLERPRQSLTEARAVRMRRVDDFRNPIASSSSGRLCGSGFSIAGRLDDGDGLCEYQVILIAAAFAAALQALGTRGGLSIALVLAVNNVPERSEEGGITYTKLPGSARMANGALSDLHAALPWTNESMVVEARVVHVCRRVQAPSSRVEQSSYLSRALGLFWARIPRFPARCPWEGEGLEGSQECLSLPGRLFSRARGPRGQSSSQVGQPELKYNPLMGHG